MAEQAEEVREEDLNRSYSDNSFSKPGTLSRTEEELIHDFTESSPPIVDLSRDKSRAADGRLKNIPGPRTLFPSQSTPDLAGDCPPLIEPDNGCHTPAINFYSSCMIKFRNSVWMHFLQLVLSAIPVFAVVIGVIFAKPCPKAYFLPIFGAVEGAFGVIFMAGWMYWTYNNRRKKPCSTLQAYIFGMVGPIFALMTLLDMIFVFSLGPSPDPASPDYCHQTFYNFAFYKEIATAAATVLSVLVYVPGNHHIFCCHDCNNPYVVF